MQQSPQMMNGSAPSNFPPPTNITTEQIQKYLDENKQLIMAIMETQNLGKSAECAMYQAQLQQNLTYLAKIADSQPPAPTMPSQMPSQPTMQQGIFMQHPQAKMSQQQQPGPFAPKLAFQLNEQQQQQLQQSHYLQQQQQQLIQGQMGMRPGATSAMYQAMHAGLGGNVLNMQGSNQDGSETGAGDFLGKLVSGHNSGDTEP